ncbi:MAG: radical SAM family heme chaperone HemW [Chloroflexaceae bacterium]|nr:radical SAM family heme chaperone HemW [Chloroflexaceae bacterium]
MGQPQHLYIHIPFCHHRCCYCDFVTYAGMEDRIEAYVAAVCRELAMLAQIGHGTPACFRAPLRPSIFFGGGTPSLLSPAQIERIIATAEQVLPLADAEISLEVNPGSFLGTGLREQGRTARHYFGKLAQMGINRLSLGVQTLHDPTLRVIGRQHTAMEARQCYDAARRVGFAQISLDMMFGLPGQTLAQWQADLEEIIAWQPEHLSVYSLILEERAPLYQQVAQGALALPDDDTSAMMYEMTLEQLATAGYVGYEISNWARIDSVAGLDTRCQHNLAYWLNSDYLAAGAAAHGHIFPARYANLAQIDTYIAEVSANRRPVETWVHLNQADGCAETMMMGLRLHTGVRYDHFQQRCGCALDAVYGGVLERLVAQGLLERDEHAVWLTYRGRMIGNQVFMQFLESGSKGSMAIPLRDSA